MKLHELARGVPGATLEGNGDVEITGIAYDSRRVKPGDIFVAVEGLQVDGHAYVSDALAAGAAAIAIERDVPVPPGTPLLRMQSTRVGLAELAAEFYGRPSRRLKLAGITGTDGKTTTTHMAEHVLQASGLVAGAMSTVSFTVSGRETDNLSGQTTIEAPEVQGWLARMLEAGVEYAVIETTSHALVQERVRACEFDVAAFTNVGHDHLDYHATWEDYLESKARLIDLTAASADKGIEKTAVLNRDDRSYERLARRPIARRWSYGLTTAADLHPLDLNVTGSGSRFRMKTPLGETEVDLHVPARFNIYNALCAAGVCLALGVPLDAVGTGLAGFEGVRGRLEPVDMGQDFRVFGGGSRERSGGAATFYLGSSHRGVRRDGALGPRPSWHGAGGGGLLGLFHHHHRRSTGSRPGGDRPGGAVGRRGQGPRARLRDRDRPPGGDPPGDRARSAGGLCAARREGARAVDEDGGGV